MTFAGLVSDGLYQINVTVPSGTPSGDQTVFSELQRRFDADRPSDQCVELTAEFVKEG